MGIPSTSPTPTEMRAVQLSVRATCTDSQSVLMLLYKPYQNVHVCSCVFSIELDTEMEDKIHLYDPLSGCKSHPEWDT